MAIQTHTSIFSELADFLVSQPALETIVEFQLPESVSERVHSLLERSREGQLTPDEREELNFALAADHFMTLMKAKARKRLADE